MKRCALPSLAVAAVFLIGISALAATKSTAVIEKCWKDGRSHEAIVQCAANERKKSENDLEAVYAGLRETQDKALAAALTQSEAAFKSFVEAECAYEAGLYGNSKGAADQKELCLIKLTSEQAARLREIQKPHQ